MLGTPDELRRRHHRVGTFAPCNINHPVFLLGVLMAKTYRTPTVATLGAADVVTRGLSSGGPSEIAPPLKPTFVFTTHAMLDL
jgi:hypothetical protein